MKQETLQQKIKEAVDNLDKQYGTHKAVAIHFGIDEGDFSRKYNGKSEWTLTEAASILSESGYSLVHTDELAALRIFALKGLKGEQ